jgi:hypothetical protein
MCESMAKGDAMMMDCAKVCRRCSEACMQMAKSVKAA